jgi:hypothetical protein
LITIRMQRGKEQKDGRKNQKEIGRKIELDFT